MEELNYLQRLRYELYKREENLVKAELAFNFIVYGTISPQKGADFDIDSHRKTIKFTE